MSFTWKRAALLGLLAVCSPIARAGTRYVDDDAPPGGNGASWETAFTFLQDALTAAVSEDEIHVAQGTYYPDRDGAHPSGTGDRYGTFQLENGVALRGGYAGLGATDPDERDIALYETILSGDIGTLGDSSDNSYHVVVIVFGATAMTVLDGLTITGGKANGSAPADRGGGMYAMEGGEPTVTDCTFSSNTASGSGGGMYIAGQAALTNCTFSNNSASASGGFYAEYGLTLTNCTFSENSAGRGGGADMMDGILTDCAFVANSATISGGGLCSYGSAALINCTFSANTASSGGGLYDSGSPTLTNCTFSGNSASYEGGGLCNDENDYYYGYPTLTGCTFNENSAAYGGAVGVEAGSATLVRCALLSNLASGVLSGGKGGGAYVAQYAGVTASDCVIARNIATNDGGGIYSAGSPVYMLNCTVAQNIAVFFGGGLCATATSTLENHVRNCVLWQDVGGIGAEIAVTDSAVLHVAYSDMQGGADAAYVGPNATLWWGLGNLDLDPFFSEPDEDNYRLLGGSPCIDAGDSFDVVETADLDGNPRIVDDPNTPDTGLGGPPVVDLGAYEFQPQRPYVTGDVNCDGSVDFGDINSFVLYLSNFSTWAATYPECPPENGDINGDGTYGEASFGDINPFVALLTGS